MKVPTETQMEITQENKNEVLKAYNAKNNTNFKNWDELKATITKLQDANEAGNTEMVENAQADVMADIQAIQTIAKQLKSDTENDERAEIFSALESSGLIEKYRNADTAEKKEAIFNQLQGEFNASAGDVQLALSGDSYLKMMTKPVGSGDPTKAEIKKIRELNDFYQFAMAAKDGYNLGGGSTEPMLKEFSPMVSKNVLAQMKDMNLEGFEVFEKGLNEALDTVTTNQGIEWLPTVLSADYIDAIFVQSQVAGQFERYPMPSKTWEKPTVTSRGRPYRVTESTANTDLYTNKFTAHQANTDKITFVAEKLGYQAFWSDEVAMDSLPDIVGMLQEDLRRSFAYGLDDVVINGSDSLADLDNAAASKLFTSAGDLRNAWDGLRLHGSTLANWVDGSTLSAAVFLQARAELGGKYGGRAEDLFLAVAPKTYYNMLTLNEVETADLHGVDRATIRNGVLRAIYGMDIIMSDEIYTNLNASGVYDNVTTTKTVALVVYRPGYAFGDRKLMTVERDRFVAAQQNMIVGHMRLDFQPKYPTQDTVAVIRNIS